MKAFVDLIETLIVNSFHVEAILEKPKIIRIC